MPGQMVISTLNSSVHDDGCWIDFLKYTLKACLNPGCTTLWRGQADFDWSLRPSIARDLSRVERQTTSKASDHMAGLEFGVKECILAFENELYQDFVKFQSLYGGEPRITENTDKVLTWMVMQHHGFPTRILDWTTNPLVAAYNAVFEEFDKDGAIFLLESVIDAIISEQQLGSQSIWITPCINHTRRSIAQAGMFTIAGSNPAVDHEKLLEDYPWNLTKIKIPKETKKLMKTWLERFNISAHTLYPDLEGFAKHSHARLSDKLHLFTMCDKASVQGQ